MSLRKATQAVQAYTDICEELQDVIEVIKRDAGEDVWDEFLRLLDARRGACDMARKAVRVAGTTVHPFQCSRPTRKQVWNVDRVVALAEKREELPDLIDQGVVGYTFNPAAAADTLSKSSMKIYEDEALEIEEGSRRITGPKPTDGF